VYLPNLLCRRLKDDGKVDLVKGINKRDVYKVRVTILKNKKYKNCAKLVLRCAANRTSISQKMKRKLKKTIFKVQHRPFFVRTKNQNYARLC